MDLTLNSVLFEDLFEDDELVTNLTTNSNNQRSYSAIEKLFYHVFNDLKDNKGELLTNKIIFRKTYYDVILKCDICNSMEYIYSLLNKFVPPSEKIYHREESVEFIDELDYIDESNDQLDESNDCNLSEDVAKIIFFIHYLEEKRIPQEFVAGFLILMIKYIYKDL